MRRITLDMTARGRASIRRLTRFQRRLRRSESGVAAIEFGFIAPIMLVMLVGIVDISNAVSLNWRMVQLNRTLSDLSSQNSTLSLAGVNNIFAASSAVLSPYRGPAPRMVISSVIIDNARVARVCWSSSNISGAALVRNTVVPLPNTDLAVPNTSLIVTTASLTYTGIISPNFNMSAKSLYFRPRNGDRSTTVEQVVREGQAACTPP